MAEDFDVADRGSFYDAVGTVRDVVQNHLLQVLAYLLMEPPTSEEADDQRDAKHRLLCAMRAIEPAEAVRGRYDGYTETPGVKAGSTTETYVALHTARRQLAVDRACRSTCARGRRCRSRCLDVVARAAHPAQAAVHRLVRRAAAQPAAAAGAARRRASPSRCWPGSRATPKWRCRSRSRDFRKVLGPMHAAYEHIFADALAGNPAHFARFDNLEQAWRIVGPILDLRTPPDPYARGSWGNCAR